MKKLIISLLLFLVIVFFASGQTREPMDIIMLLDTSASMSGSYRELANYISGPFLKDSLEVGDTFHLISFSSSPHHEISRRIETTGDIETILSRLFLLLPIDPYSNIVAALAYAERYALDLPASRSRKMLFITDGEQNPEPGTSGAAQDSRTVEALALETAARLRGNRTDFQWIRFSPLESPRSAQETPVRAQRPEPTPAAAPINEAPQPPEPAVQPVTSTPAKTEAPPQRPARIEQGAFNYAPLLVCLGSIFLLGLLIFFILLRLKKRKSSGPARSTIRPAAVDSAFPRTAIPAVKTEPVPAQKEPTSAVKTEPVSTLKESITAAEIKKEESPPEKQRLALGGQLLNLGQGIKKKSEPLEEKPAEPLQKIPPKGPRSEKTPKEKPVEGESLLVSLVVDDQNKNIGRRNIHSLKNGDIYTVGGGKLDDYFIFLAPVPARIGELQYNSGKCTFVPKKAQYFPETSSRPIPDCIGKIIHVTSDKGYKLTLHFELCEEPPESLIPIPLPARSI
ncbi:MAG: VWA domain-containing protein [Treponema sp.]|jgi:hypothetical protein|nr:VWA domain-containing protein [Treponema sp.]